MVIVIFVVVLMLVSFIGAAVAQDPQTVSALMGVGGGAGGVGGVTGVTSLIQSSRVSKNLDTTHSELRGLQAEIHRAIEAGIAQEGDKNALQQQLTQFQRDVKEDLGQMSSHIDRLQSEMHEVSLEFARISSGRGHPGHRSNNHEDRL